MTWCHEYHDGTLAIYGLARSSVCRPSKPISAIGNDPWCAPLVFYSAAECATSEAARRLSTCKPTVSYASLSVAGKLHP